MNQVVIIKPSSPWWSLDFRELWSYRELFFVLAWRDISVRYKQTLLGISWVVFQPLVTTGIFSIFFGKIAKIPSDNLPYPLFVLVGITFWNFFANGLTLSSQSLINNEAILKKVYLPKIIIPISSLVASSIDFIISILLVVAVIIFYRVIPNFYSFWVIIILLIILFLFTSGLGLFMSSLNVKYRDVRYVLPFFIQIGFFASPIIFPISVIFDYRKLLLILNPLSSVIETSRAIITGSVVDWNLIFCGLIVSLITFIFGLYYFNNTEKYFADIA